MPQRRDTLDAGAIRAWCTVGTQSLHAAQAEIDALNVYPVPDGDTGTNLFLTMRAVTEAVDDLPTDADAEAVLEALARGALMGARGNSGVILSQLLRGCVDVLVESAEDGDARLDGPALHAALERGAKLAWQAVAHPVDGTILTVARAAAERCASVDGDVLTVARAAADGAADALTHTPEQLNVLADAGVVDAGGRGLVVLLDALVAVLAGDTDAAPTRSLPPPLVDRKSLAEVREQGSEDYAFEVMYLLEANDTSVPALRDKLDRLGDSLVVVGGGGLWNVHVHVNDVGGAIEAGIVAGRPHRVSVTHFATQAAARERAALAVGRAVVAIAPGGGLAALFTASGANVLDGVPDRVPTGDDVLRAIAQTGAREVVLLPNDDSAHEAADEAANRARDDGIVVAVVPTRASVQGLAALAVHDDDRPFDEDVIAMTAAARATRHGEVTVAEGRALTSAGVCETGDILGFLEGDVAVIGDDVFNVAAHIVDRLLIGGGELVTCVTGADAAEDLGGRLTDYLRATRPTVDTVVYEGGQRRYPLLLGVE